MVYQLPSRRDIKLRLQSGVQLRLPSWNPKPKHVKPCWSNPSQSSLPLITPSPQYPSQVAVLEAPQLSAQVRVPPHQPQSVH